MIIQYACQNGMLRIVFQPENADPKSFPFFSYHFKKLRTITMGMSQCVFQLPTDWTLKSIHPDLLAIAAIAVVYPFCGPRITLPFGISRELHTTFKRLTKKNLHPVDDALKPRKAPDTGIPALCYSGGMDSTAALLLLPDTCHSFFVDRITPARYRTKNGLLNKESAYFACESLKKLGRAVTMTKTDLEYIRNPVGFSTPFAHAAPAILLADYFQLDSIADGMNIGDVYSVGHGGFQDCTEYRFWGELLNVVDLPINMVTGGMGVPATTSIVIHSPYRTFAQACSRGNVHKPCMNCEKCFRKITIERIISKIDLDDSYLDRMFRIRDVQQIINKCPIFHEMDYAYITGHYSGNHPIMNLLKKKTRGDKFPNSWLDKWYSPSAELFAPKYRKFVTEKILDYLQPMTFQDEEHVRNWNFSKDWDINIFQTYADKLDKALRNYR